MALPAAIISKADFARLKGVSRSRVSQWLSEGKIGFDAVIGHGRKAKIDVLLADEQLKRRLDISQRLGNGLGTKLGPAAVATAPDFPNVGLAPSDAIEEKIKREKLEGLQRENRKRAEEEAFRSGLFTYSQVAKAQMAKIAAQDLTIFEGALMEIAATVAAKFEIPMRDILHLMRHEFRAVRGRAAVSLKQQALAVQEFIEVDVEPVFDTVAAE
jgi:hypothetical protein